MAYTIRSTGCKAQQHNAKRGVRVDREGGMGTGKIEKQENKVRGNLLMVLNNGDKRTTS